MNWVAVSLAVFAALFSVCSGKLCSEASDCSETQCCVAITALTLKAKGLCRNLERLNRICNEPEAKLDYYGDKYVQHCPCQEGLECKPTKETDDRFKRLQSLKCQKPSEPEPEPETEEPRTEEPRTEEPRTPEPETPGPNPEPETETEPDPEPQTEPEPDTLPDEVAEGPGGEKPRDDDCANWEYPC